MSNDRNLPKNVFRPPNTKFYWLRVKINGHTHRESLRTTSVRVAEKKAKSRVNDLRGMEKAGEIAWTFSAGWLKFYERLGEENAGWSVETCKRYRCSLRQILRVLDEVCEDLGQDIRTIAAAEVQVGLVSEFVSRRREEEAKFSTINRDLTAFTQLMTAIKNDGWIEENPVNKFEKQGMKEVLPDIVLPTEAAITRISDRAPGTLAYFAKFLGATGGRVTEMALLQWSDIRGMENPVPGNVFATLRKTKGGKVRTIELTQRAIDILLDIPQSNVSEYLFWNNTEHGYYKDPANLFWQYGQEVEFGARLHDLRHKFAIERLREGWSIYKVQKYIGHGSVLTTERYYLRYLSQQQQDRVRSDGDNGLMSFA